METLSFRLQTFEGPLDLLLHLIAKNKVNIYDIPIAQILEQYMQYMDDAKRSNIEVKSEFVTMAAQLVLIKSKMLLPKDDTHDENEDPRANLVEMLLEYQQIKQMSGFFVNQAEVGRDIFVKQSEELPKKIEEAPPAYDYSAAALIKAIGFIEERYGRRALPSPEAFCGIVGREKASVGDKIELIINLLQGNKNIELSEILKYSKSRSEIVATFLALLELLKDKHIFADETDGECTVGIYEQNNLK